MSARLFLAQRLSAGVLAIAVIGHLVGILSASRANLTAAEVLARTHGNMVLLAFYVLFVVAAAVHAPIGLRTVIREWTPWQGRSLDICMWGAGVALLVLGMRAAIGVFAG